MKRYIKCSKKKSGVDFLKVTSKNWDEFLNKIEEATGLKVDSAYRRKYRGEDDILLVDEKARETYHAGITKYTDGTYELMSYNIYRT